MVISVYVHPGKFSFTCEGRILFFMSVFQNMASLLRSTISLQWGCSHFKYEIEKVLPRLCVTCEH